MDFFAPNRLVILTGWGDYARQSCGFALILIQSSHNEIIEGIFMDPDSMFSLFLLLVFLLSGAFFSATETAFSTLNRICIKSLMEADPRKTKRATLVLTLHDQFDKLLTTLLVGNNVVTLAAAAVSTLLFMNLLGERLGDDGAAAVSTVILTVVIVFFGDITPKSVAKESPEKIAMFFAPMLHFFVVLMTPANWLFGLWKGLLRRMFNLQADERSMNELFSFVEEAQQDGIIDAEDKQRIENAIEFDERKAVDIITHRTDIVAVEKDDAMEEVVRLLLETEYSRMPVYKETIDNIVGVVHMRDVFKAAQTGKKPTLSKLLTPVPFVAPSITINTLFKQLQKDKSHLAVVIDEHGGTAGIVTMEDVLEELVGDIWDESDEVVESFVQLEDGRHKVLCSAYIHDLFEYFDMPETDESDATTVSGWIMDMLEKIPEKGDTFQYNHLTVTVHKAENRRALECLVTVATDDEK